MAHRKTIAVAEILAKANYFLANSKQEQVAERKGTHNLTVSILHDTGNYRGFGYLNMFQDADGKWFVPDESRTVFYVDSRISADYRAIEEERKNRGY